MDDTPKSAVDPTTTDSDVAQSDEIVVNAVDPKLADPKLAGLTYQQFSKKTIINVDLINGSRKQIAFLEEVNKYPSLFEGSVLKNAIRRYEKLWLPLIAANPKKIIHPPLDIHWVWHVHMLAPYYYEKDCMRLVGTVIDHQLTFLNSQKQAIERAQSTWWTSYKDEPFEVVLDETVGKQSGSDYVSQCKYDIEYAVSRQKMFYYQVSLPHYTKDTFLGEAVKRYKKFLYLKQRNPQIFLVPCYDFDLVWHTHQLHPLIYKRDTEAVLGRMLNHDDSVTDRSPEAKLMMSDVTTRELWKTTFNEDFMVCGAMYRGDPPFGRLTKVSDEQVRVSRIKVLT